MDPFSQLLRKQRERSSTRARQLNQSALTLLTRQLHALDRRQLQDARGLLRTRQAILQELDASSQHLEHDGGPEESRLAPPPPRLLHQPTLLPPLGESDSPMRSPAQLIGPRPGVVSSQARDAGCGQGGGAKGGSDGRPCRLSDLAQPNYNRSSSSWASRDPAEPPAHQHQHQQQQQQQPASAFRRHHLSLAGGGGSSSLSYPSTTVQSSCRFGTLPPLRPCRHFPCTRPLSYPRLKASDVPYPDPNPDPQPLGGERGRGAGPTRGQALSAALFSDTKKSSLPRGLSDEERSSSTFFRSSLVTAAGDEGSHGRRGGRSASAGVARQRDGHVSPRTSVQERLRGLRQLVGELRAKNEEKRPRDWAVNYGDPVSRRLLRKPVVAVSEVL